jgi:integrase
MINSHSKTHFTAFRSISEIYFNCIILKYYFYLIVSFSFITYHFHSLINGCIVVAGMASRAITSKEALSLKAGKTHSEPIGGRGSGTLLLVGREKQVSAYYRYTAPNGVRPWVELGLLGPKFSLKQARERCIAYWNMRKDYPYLKEHLEGQAHVEKERFEEQKRNRLEEQKTATLKELLDDYTTFLEDQGRISAKAIRKTLDSKVTKAHPLIVAKKAKSIKPADIQEILTPLSRDGKKVYRNRIRSYLHAAFKYGLDREYDETRTSGKVFGLTVNPVAAIPVLAGVESAGERSLSEVELKLLYLNLSETKGVGVLMSCFIRYLIAIGGQRPSQVLRAKWSDYNLEQGYFKTVDRKGRGSKDRIHLVPLSQRAIGILEQVRPLTGGYQWPFSHNGKQPISIQSLKNAARRFLVSDSARGMEPFTIRDLRRTCKHVMIRNKTSREQRNLLQNHGQTGVDSKHYDNDPHAHLPAKKETMAKYERALKRIFEDYHDKKVVKIDINN